MLPQTNIALLFFTIFLFMCGVFYFLYNKIVSLEKFCNSKNESDDTDDLLSESGTEFEDDKSSMLSDSDSELFDSDDIHFKRHLNDVFNNISSETLDMSVSKEMDQEQQEQQEEDMCKIELVSDTQKKTKKGTKKTK